MENEAWRDHFGSVHGGPALGQRKNKKMTKEDKLTGRQTGRGGEGRGNYRAGTSPAGTLAHVPCCHTKGGSICVGLKDGGKRERYYEYYYYYVFFSLLRLRRCPYMGKHSQELGSSTAIRIGMWHDKSTDKQKRGLAGEVGRCTYGEAARCVP